MSLYLFYLCSLLEWSLKKCALSNDSLIKRFMVIMLYTTHMNISVVVVVVVVVVVYVHTFAWTNWWWLSITLIWNDADDNDNYMGLGVALFTHLVALSKMASNKWERKTEAELANRFDMIMVMVMMSGYSFWKSPRSEMCANLRTFLVWFQTT